MASIIRKAKFCCLCRHVGRCEAIQTSFVIYSAAKQECKNRWRFYFPKVQYVLMAWWLQDVQIWLTSLQSSGSDLSPDLWSMSTRWREEWVWRWTPSWIQIETQIKFDVKFEIIFSPTLHHIDKTPASLESSSRAVSCHMWLTFLSWKLCE